MLLTGGMSASSSLIILHQLEDKIKVHMFMVDFLKNVGLWEKVRLESTSNFPVCTRTNLTLVYKLFSFRTSL